MKNNYYTLENIPKKGKAKEIWNVIENIKELHYNPNCFGKGKVLGWGTWALTLNSKEQYFCGVDNFGVYLQQMTAPYKKVHIKK